MKIAIVTGASSGLGQEFVKLLAKQKRYEEIWVIARRKDRLEKLKKDIENKYKIVIKIFSYDLSETQSINEIREILRIKCPDVKMLINAAGYGKIGKCEDLSFEDTQGMVKINCIAPIMLTKAVLPYMNKGAHIMQICSTAAFQPFQYLGIYSASKAFLYRYSRALRVELFARKISVTAVCPYWIKDTEFINIAEKNSDNSNKKIRNYPLSSKQKNVAALALHDTMIGMAVSTPGIMCTIHRFIAKIIPSELMMGIWALLRRI